jgi:hypothetical protein
MCHCRALHHVTGSPPPPPSAWRCRGWVLSSLLHRVAASSPLPPFSRFFGSKVLPSHSPLPHGSFRNRPRHSASGLAPAAGSSSGPTNLKPPSSPHPPPPYGESLLCLDSSQIKLPLTISLTHRSCMVVFNSPVFSLAVRVFSFSTTLVISELEVINQSLSSVRE